MMSVEVFVQDQVKNVLASMCSLKIFIIDQTIVEAYRLRRQWNLGET
jgi:hypothetical protein